MRGGSAIPSPEGRTTMALTLRQRTLLHIIVQRYDRNADATYLDPVALEGELNTELPDLSEDIDVLETDGYVERVSEDAMGPGGLGWTVRPSDRGILAAMGLGD